MVDNNIGKLVKWMRMMGYDTVFFSGSDDSGMVAIARVEVRVILTRDTQIMKRRLITSGRLRAILIVSAEPERQQKQARDTLNLELKFRPFSLCLECNQPLVERSGEQVKERVPAYIFKIQDKCMECPACHRLYWRGTHWQAMNKTLDRFIKS